MASPHLANLLLLVISCSQMIPILRADQALVDQFCADLPASCQRCIEFYSGVDAEAKGLTKIAANCSEDTVKGFVILAGFILTNTKDLILQTALTHCVHELQAASAFYDQMQRNIDAGDYQGAWDQFTIDMASMVKKCGEEHLSKLPDSDAKRQLEFQDRDTVAALVVLEAFLKRMMGGG